MFDRPQARTEGIVSEWVEDDLVIYDQVSQTAHSLSAAAASVWELCDGRHTASDISKESGLRLSLVEHASAELRDRGLLDVGSADGTIAGSASDLGYSRRDAAKRFAQVGGAALTAPLIYSVAVPASAAAASCAAGKTKCGTVATNCCSNATQKCCGSGSGATCCAKAQNCCGNRCCPNGQSCINVTVGCCVTSQICGTSCCPEGCNEDGDGCREFAPIKPAATPNTSTSSTTPTTTATTTTTTATTTTTTTVPGK